MRFFDVRSFFRVLFYVGLLLSPAAMVTAHAADRWLIGKTSYFEVLSTASETETRRIVTALEQFRAYFTAAFPLPGASEPRTSIVIFDSDRAFRPFKPLYEGKPKDVAGYFLGGADEIVIALTTDLPSSDEDATATIFHEYVHLLLHVRDAKFPVWLNEGMAELFSTFTVENQKVVIGKAIPGHVGVLQNTALIPLERLFATTPSSPDYNEELRAGIFYAQSWALTHYLLCGEDKTNAAKLSEFIRLLSRGEPVEPSFRAAFKQDYGKLQLELRGYLHGGRYYTRATPTELAAVNIELRPATPAEQEFALINLGWRVHEAGDAALRALRLVDQAPKYARPHELLAALAIAEGDTLTALKHWRAASDKLSDNAHVYVQLANDALSAHTGAGLLDARLPDARINELRRWLGRALTISPENHDALELTALTEALANQLSAPMVNRVQAAVPRMRDPARTLLALAVIRSRANDPKTALAIIDMLLGYRDADMDTRAAAHALRDRLRAHETAPEVDVSPAAEPSARFAGEAAIGLQAERATVAETVVDRMLLERKSLAPRLKLEPVAVAATKSSEAADAWRDVDAARSRATQGDAAAIFHVAVAHACGIGAEFSPALALEWLQRAAAAGHELAKSTSATDGTLLCRFLRQQHPTATPDTMPPLDADIAAQVAHCLQKSGSWPYVALSRQAPRYPPALQRAGRGGEVAIEIVILPNGHAELFRVLGSPDPLLRKAVEDIIGSWRFLPGIRDGRVVRTLVETSIRFQAK